MQDPASHLGQASVARKLPQTLSLVWVSGSLVGGCSRRREGECCVAWDCGPTESLQCRGCGTSPRNCNLGTGEGGYWEGVFSVKASGKYKGGVVP